MLHLSSDRGFKSVCAIRNFFSFEYTTQRPNIRAYKITLNLFSIWQKIKINCNTSTRIQPKFETWRIAISFHLKSEKICCRWFRSWFSISKCFLCVFVENIISIPNSSTREFRSYRKKELSVKSQTTHLFRMWMSLCTKQNKQTNEREKRNFSRKQCLQYWNKNKPRQRDRTSKKGEKKAHTHTKWLWRKNDVKRNHGVNSMLFELVWIEF